MGCILSSLRDEKPLALKGSERVIGGCQSCSQADQFCNSLFAFFSFQSLDGIGDQRDTAATFEQAFGGIAYSVYSDYPKDDEFRLSAEFFHKRISVAAFEDVQRLLFQQNLLVTGQIIG